MANVIIKQSGKGIKSFTTYFRSYGKSTTGQIYYEKNEGTDISYNYIGMMYLENYSDGDWGYTDFVDIYGICTYEDGSTEKVTSNNMTFSITNPDWYPSFTSNLLFECKYATSARGFEFYPSFKGVQSANILTVYQEGQPVITTRDCTISFRINSSEVHGMVVAFECTVGDLVLSRNDSGGSVGIYTAYFENVQLADGRHNITNIRVSIYEDGASSVKVFSGTVDTPFVEVSSSNTNFNRNVNVKRN